MSFPMYHVDAFITNEPFSGNPAGVCLLGNESADPRWLQMVAMEMNLSETAFLMNTGDGFNLQWFTPTVEVALCGHATLASAHILWETGVLQKNTCARFHTKSGLLTASTRDGVIELDFPVKKVQEIGRMPDLERALGVTPTFTGKNEFDYLLEVSSEESVRTLAPDFSLLRRMAVRGVMVTSQSHQEGIDFVSRFFAPGSGIDEDPVTGSAHCALGPYWMERLGKKSFTAFQASPRGGMLRVVLHENDRVGLSGRARTTVSGHLL